MASPQPVDENGDRLAENLDTRRGLMQHDAIAVRQGNHMLARPCWLRGSRQQVTQDRLHVWIAQERQGPKRRHASPPLFSRGACSARTRRSVRAEQAPRLNKLII